MTGQSENKDMSHPQAQTCWDSGIPQDSAHCSQELNSLCPLTPVPHVLSGRRSPPSLASGQDLDVIPTPRSYPLFSFGKAQV